MASANGARKYIEAGTVIPSNQHSRLTTASDNVSVYAGGAILTSVIVTGITATARWLKIYDKASAPAPASDAALLVATVPIPASGVGSLIVPAGITFSSGLAYAVVANIADADATAVLAGDARIQLNWVNLS